VKRFSETHEWAEVEGHIATVGISQFAAKELGDIVFVELPHVGQLLSAGDVVSVLESTKAASDVYSPLSGEVTEVNVTLKKSPELISTAPEDGGWIYKMTFKDILEVQDLLDKESYEQMIKG